MSEDMDTRWLNGTFQGMNKALGLVSTATYMDKVEPLLTQVGAEGLLNMAGQLGVGDPGRLRRLARERPNLPNFLSSKEAREAAQAWTEAHLTELEELQRKLALLERWGRPGIIRRFADRQGDSALSTGDQPPEQVWQAVYDLLQRDDPPQQDTFTHR
ncbi:MAG: hypothetical protein HY672_03210 [Chloroflexi bacterium]|nr:hypothetical protein [Chloroflexota bacterium]